MLGRPLPNAGGIYARLALRVRGVVRGHLEAPQILFHGLLAARSVFLGIEGNLILSDLGEILRTVCYCGRNGCEALTDFTLVSGDRRAAFHLLAQVKTVTLRVGGRCYTVGTKQHLLTAVLGIRSRFAQCAGYAVYSGTPYYICHNL